MEPPIQLLPRIMVFPRFSFFSLHFHFLFLLLVFFSNNERPRASVDRSSVGIDFSAAQALSSLRWITPDPGIAEGTFPVASAIGVWVRDPPAVSSLPARGS